MKKSYIFDSIGEDRVYNASDFTDYFSKFITNGYFPNIASNLEVVADGTSMNVILQSGAAWVDGRMYHNTDDLTLPISVANGVLNRIDRVVIRCDYLDREIRAEVREGVFSSTPVAPTLQRDVDAYELCVAEIFVQNGTISVSQSNITDTRLDTELCGVVNSLLQADTTAIFNQYQDWFERTSLSNERVFQDWFDSVKGGMGEDTTTEIIARVANLEKNLGIVKVPDLVGDGVYDDSIELQKTLDLANKNGGVTVFVPAGTYRVGSTLHIYKNTKLTCHQNATFIRDHTNVMVLNADSGDLFREYEGNGNIQITGGIWDHNVDNLDRTKSGTVFAIGHAENILFRDVQIENVGGGHGIEVNSSRNVLIDNCTFRGFLNTGERDFSELIQLDLARDSGVFPWFGAYDYTPCENVTIQHCYFGTGRVGNPARCIGSHSATPNKSHKNIKIVNNTFENADSDCVRPYNWENVLISANTFKNVYSGILLRSIDPRKPLDTIDENGNDTRKSYRIRQFTLTDNTFENITDQEVIYVGGQETGFVEDLTIRGNKHIQDAKTEATGVYLTYVKGFQIDGNTIENTGMSSVDIRNSSHGHVSNNQLSTTDITGVETRTSSYIKIQDNTISNAKLHGVYLTESVSFVDVLNNRLSLIGHGGYKDASVLRVTQQCSDIFVTGNRVDNGGFRIPFGFYTTSTSTNVQRFGNYWGNLSQTPIRDTSNSYTKSDDYYY